MPRGYSGCGGVLQAAVSARLQILGFDAGRGTPQSLLVWFFEMLLLPPSSSFTLPAWYISDEADAYGEYGWWWACGLWYG